MTQYYERTEEDNFEFPLKIIYLVYEKEFNDVNIVVVLSCGCFFGLFIGLICGY